MDSKSTAEVKEISLNKSTREIIVRIDAKGSIYVEEPKEHGFPMLMNGASLIEGINYVLEFHYHAVEAMKGNSSFVELVEENRILKNDILDSNLAARVRQFLSSLDYNQLTNFQAKCALLLEKELK